MEDRRLQSCENIHAQTVTLNDLLNMALEEVVSLSDSKVGYIYYYSEEKEEFTLHAWSKNVMESCTIQDPQIPINSIKQASGERQYDSANPL